MLANNKIRPLVELTGNSGQLKPLPVLSSYAGFIPNEVFDECAPLEALVYAVIQYLSFFSIRCTTANIAKNLNASASAIKNARNSLSKRRFIDKSKEGAYSFKKDNLTGSTDFVDARELPTKSNRGYWLPVETLKSKKLTNQEKKAFSLIKSLTNKKEMKIQMSYIAHKLSISRRAATPIIHRLLSENLISRDRPYCRSAYIYQTGGQEMSIYKQNLPTGTPTGRTENEQPNQKGTQNFPSKGTQNFPSLSINKSNKYLIDIGKEQRESTSYQTGQKKSLFFVKEILDFLLVELNRMDTHRKHEEVAPDLDAQYTKACVDGDIEKIQELRARMAVVDIKTKKDTQITSNVEKTNAILSDYEYYLKDARLPKLSDEQRKKIGEAVKAKIDVVTYEEPKKRKMAFCLIFNSIILDISEQVARTSDMEKSIELCLKKLASDNYDLNYELVPKNVQEKYSGRNLAANESYRNWMD